MYAIVCVSLYMLLMYCRRRKTSAFQTTIIVFFCLVLNVLSVNPAINTLKPSR